MSLSQRLRALMRWRGIHSQNQLARLSGVPQSCIHRILTREDRYSPARNTLVRLARALGTSVPWLTDGVVHASSPKAGAGSGTGSESGSAAGFGAGSGPGSGTSPGLQNAAADGMDGYCAEICARLAPQPDSTKRLILALVRELSSKPDTAAARAAARKCA
ncbi:MAG: helix-turn-helix domain-containing protein [Achromobacter sp.]|uniref:helix-turn-helix domain-containing protein n=1 Tax=unclassified Achromobacter TaxID=2626865 RepID=UPI0006FE7658|nr:helix-turn-helix transcriptional regulator [Achromobacter sp. Root565]KRA03338.1 DNA-binding protein [Achromobacter sp. Root565]